MSNFRKEYKKKTAGFGNIAENRFIRAKQYEESRKQQRSEKFNTNRNVSTDLVKIQNKEIQLDPLEEDRMTRLMKWKTEREKRKKLEQSKKKPAFVVGSVHHKIYSPPKEDTSVKLVKKCEPVPKRLTKLTEKRLMNKALAKKVNAKRIIKSPNRITEVQQKQKIKEQSFNPKITTGLPLKPLFGRVVLQSMSPAKMNAVLPPISRISSLNNKSKNAIFDIKTDEPIIDCRSENCDIRDSSVESISLKLSLDNKESFNSSNNTNSNDNKELTNNGIICNDSLTEAIVSKNNVSIPLDSNIPLEPVFFSPYVVNSRGKSNARKEQQMKRGFSLSHSLNDDIPTKDTVMKKLNISVEEEERTAQYFQFLLNRETDRLNDLCEKWVQVKLEPETTEDGLYEINQAIGQTKLLISKKFERFRGLVGDCETGKGEMLVTCKDLQGFWDMMYMEVKNCNLRFEKLEKLRSQGWKEEEFVDRPITKKRTTVKKKVTSVKSGSIRAFLAEKKRKMAAKMRNDNDGSRLESNKNQIVNNRYQKNENLSSKTNKRKSMPIHFNEKKSVLPKSKRLSLLQQIQLSETSKNTKSPLTMIKISQMCKTPEVQLDDSISYVNSNQTPGKSILKQPKNSTTVESHVKPVNQVNFDDDVILNEVPIDEETQTKMDLAVALSRIDNFNFDNSDEVMIRAEKKLVFDDNSDENEDDTKQNSKLKNSTNNDTTITYTQTQGTSLEELNKNLNALRRRNIKRQNAVDEDNMTENHTRLLSMNSSTPFKKDKCHSKSDLNISKQEHISVNNTEDTSTHDETMRILRNRIIIPIETPVAKRKSLKNVSVSTQEGQQVNKTPLERTRRKSSFKVNIDSNERVNVSNTSYNTQESSNKRRLTRSVTFSEKEGSGVINKPTLPMTPHVRRSKISSNKKESSITFIGDPISLEIQEKPPERIRRSQSKKSLI